MALRFLDSCDHYATAHLLNKWTTISASPTIGSANGRHGSNSLVFGNDHHVAKTLDSQATWIIGFAVLLPTLPGATSTLLILKDGTTTQVTVQVTTTGLLQVTRAGTVLGTGTAVLSAAVFYYLELKTTINDAGSYELRVNGVTDTSGSPVDTNNGAAASANVIDFGSSQSAGARMDDIYICDATGGVNDNFLGDIRVEALFPNGNGNSSQLVGSDANSTDNYLLVDETSPNDADYVESATVGQKDTYAFTNLTPTLGTIYGIQPVLRAAKTDAGARSVASIARHSGTEVDSSNHTLSTTITYYMDTRATKPGGGSWSISDVNGAEFGVKVTA